MHKDLDLVIKQVDGEELYIRSYPNNEIIISDNNCRSFTISKNQFQKIIQLLLNQ